MNEIWNAISETFTKIFNFIKNPLLFIMLFISLLGIMFSILTMEILNIIVFTFFTFILMEMLEKSDK